MQNDVKLLSGNEYVLSGNITDDRAVLSGNCLCPVQNDVKLLSGKITDEYVLSGNWPQAPSPRGGWLKRAGRVLLTEILLPRIARRRTVCPISTGGQARKARIERLI